MLQIVVGGHSYASDVVSSINTPNPFVVFYDSSGAVKWALSMNNSYNEISSIKFGKNGNSIAGTFSTIPNVIFVLVSSNG